MKTGRNDPCPCGSGKKYKHCCLDRNRGMTRREKILFGLVSLAAVVVIAVTLVYTLRQSGGEGPERVWSEEHGHWHRAP